MRPALGTACRLHGLVVTDKSCFSFPVSSSPLTTQWQITEVSGGKHNTATCATLGEKFLPRVITLKPKARDLLPASCHRTQTKLLFGQDTQPFKAESWS